MYPRSNHQSSIINHQSSVSWGIHSGVGVSTPDSNTQFSNIPSSSNHNQDHSLHSHLAAIKIQTSKSTTSQSASNFRILPDLPDLRSLVLHITNSSNKPQSIPISHDLLIHSQSCSTASNSFFLLHYILIQQPLPLPPHLPNPKTSTERIADSLPQG